MLTCGSRTHFTAVYDDNTNSNNHDNNNNDHDTRAGKLGMYNSNFGSS